MIELGSGVGVGGISAALAGARPRLPRSPETVTRSPDHARLGAAHVTLSDLCGDEERSSSLGRASPPTRAGTACPRVRRCERSASQYSYSFAFLRPLSGVPARMASLDWDECLSLSADFVFEPARRRERESLLSRRCHRDPLRDMGCAEPYVYIARTRRCLAVVDRRHSDSPVEHPGSRFWEVNTGAFLR